jgi:class 3 adenylate cyclase/Tfp pilus assembly protein PilF
MTKRQSRRSRNAPETRRLAAVMFTDILGYTALSQKNERLALQDLEDHRRLVRSNFKAHDGREVNAMGDSFLAEFPSALSAVRCAVGIQRALSERNARLPEVRRIHVRVGVHLGDVLYRGEDIYGDAVNIASRVEALAAPGGVCVSQNVADDVRNKLSFPVVRLGRYRLKNVEAPMEIYRVALPWEEGQPERQASAQRQRLAVLPLENLSPDRNDEYFADGMTEELISTLSNIANLGVIARTSVVRYKGTKERVNQIARELNVETILEGTVRKAGRKLRVSVQLTSGASEENLWAKTFERGVENVFAIQSEIARSVAEAMAVELEAKERRQIERRGTENIAAHTLYLKGRYYWNERTESGLKSAIRYFEQAVADAPDYPLPYVGLADCYRIMGSRGFVRRESASPKAERFAKKALGIDDTLAEAHAALAASLDSGWDWSGAEAEYKRAIELNPSYASAYHWYALYLGHMGRFAEGLDAARRAEELDPLSPVISATVFEEHYLARQYDRAVDQLMKAAEVEPDFPLIHYSLGLAYVQKGKLAEAGAELRRAVSGSTEPEFKAALAYTYAISGQKDKARGIYKDVLGGSKRYLSAPYLALINLGLGEKDLAFKQLAEACEAKAEPLKHLMVDPLYDGLRSDARYLPLLKRMGLRSQRDS